MVDALTLITVLNAGHETAGGKLVQATFRSPLERRNMGIDVYMKWKGQTEEEHKAQITGFSVMHGHVGYLREAYHGEPYATEVLFPEGWSSRKQDEELGLPV